MTRIGLASLRHVSVLMLLLLSSLIPRAALAQSIEAQSIAFEKDLLRLEQIDAALSSESISSNRLDQFLHEVGEARRRAAQCVQDQEARLSTLADEKALLGEAVEGEDRRVSLQRTELDIELAAAERVLASCRLLVIQGRKLATVVDVRRDAQLRGHLFERNQSVFVVGNGDWLSSQHWKAQLENLRAELGIENDSLLSGSLSLLLLLMVIAVALGKLMVRGLALWVGKLPPGRDFATDATLALSLSLPLWGPVLLLGLALILGGQLFLGSNLGTELRDIGFLVGGFALARWLLRALLHPPHPARAVLKADEELRHRFAQRLNILFWVIFIGGLLLSGAVQHLLPEFILQALRAVFYVLLTLNIAWVALLMGDLPRGRTLFSIRLVTVLALLVGLVAELGGYQNLSEFILSRTALALLGLFVAWVISSELTDLFDGLDEGRLQWQRNMRRALGIKSGKDFPGLRWLRVLTTIAIWIALLFYGAALLGLSQQGREFALNLLIEGFKIGDYQFIPSRILVAIAVVMLLLSILGWVRQHMEKSWLAKARMERSARESLVTFTGYLGVGIAIVVGLMVAGVDFTGLAIIFGALSVGIGFGLQNVVNNFVSGLILLFERPIRTGDWIQVGSTEGYVRKISIRSTLIETFDKANVIVPNSELISAQVTNWILRDSVGRLSIPIGVAYGSDTGLVERVLLEVANAHPDVIKNNPEYRARVVFMDFGESSLDFQLRAYVPDVDRRLRISSDLRFAIDRAFRANGIEIPFPQRDLHIRSGGFTAGPAAAAPTELPSARPQQPRKLTDADRDLAGEGDA
jgi:potassium efflux system protein